MTNPVIYPHMVKELRERLGETQDGLATLLNVSTSTIAKWEAGRARPSGDHALAILRLRGEAPQPPREAASVPSTIAVYDAAIREWEDERDYRIRTDEPTTTPDSVLRVLRTTRDGLLREARDD